jgi:hypothetical protein
MSVFEKCGVSLKFSEIKNITPPSSTTNQTIEIAKSHLSRFVRQPPIRRSRAFCTMCNFVSGVSRCGLIWIKQTSLLIAGGQFRRLP